MNQRHPASLTFPIRIASPSGLGVELNSNGSIRRMDHGDIMLNLFLGNEAEGGPVNIYLRDLQGTVEATPLLGPTAPSAYEFDELGFTASGRWKVYSYRVRLVLAKSAAAWFWHVDLENTGDVPATCDLIYTQDTGLAHYGAIRLNEYYVSQYIDHCPLQHPKQGVAVASRQNQSMGGHCPWTMIGSLRKGVSFATDALQFHGLATRAGRLPDSLIKGLPGTRLQHEHAMVCIQDALLHLPPAAKGQSGFFGWFEADHPGATSDDDLTRIDAVLALPEAKSPTFYRVPGNGSSSPALFSSAPCLHALPLDEPSIVALFPGTPRHVERENGRLLSFFVGARGHVVLQEKELRVLRPHGHILRSGGSLVPDECALTSTAWMNGVFHSMVTQGHVSINRLLSTCHTYLGLFRSHGMRIFVEIDGIWNLLAVPSAFEITPESCRWIYSHRGGVIEVVSSAPDYKHELILSIVILKGPQARLLISHHIALNGDDGSHAIPARWEREGNGVFVRRVPASDVGHRFPEGGFLIIPSPETQLETIGGDELLFADGSTRHQPFLCFKTAPSMMAGLVIEGRLMERGARGSEGFWDGIGGGLQIRADKKSEAASAGRLTEIFPWFIHNALVHYLSPRGLEQYSGGGWGTRDVCQGPVELLLALGRFEPIRDILSRVFRQQNADGDWPQWFMFFDRERNIRPGDSHGDIVYWPVLALAQYLTATGDADLLDERLPFFHADGDIAAEQATVRDHLERALQLIRRRVITGTRLAAYGHGDWNDSLQPAKPEMRERLCSSWTVTLNYQTLVALAGALETFGQQSRASEVRAEASKILGEFQRTLIVDDVVAGFAYFNEAGSTDLLLHPRDQVTQLSYSVLPMIHAIINDMFTPEQAREHIDLIQRHLLGPDGVRLFDRPLVYRGGPQKFFQRAESSSFFGREIGIMYTHAHLRYCEALARFGDAEAFYHALTQINPIMMREVVHSATLRQGNCYYSSSDAFFADRYEAFAQYDRVKRGEVALEGGWRIYSSGAGICVRLIMQCFLGLRQEKHALVVDPVIPSSMDGLEASLQLAGHDVKVTYHTRGKGCGPVSVDLNGVTLEFVREHNPYRVGAARISFDVFVKHLTGRSDQLSILLH